MEGRAAESAGVAHSKERGGGARWDALPRLANRGRRLQPSVSSQEPRSSASRASTAELNARLGET